MKEKKAKQTENCWRKEKTCGEERKRKRDKDASQAIDSATRRKKIIWTNKTDGQTDDRPLLYVRSLGRKTRRRERGEEKRREESKRREEKKKKTATKKEKEEKTKKK